MRILYNFATRSRPTKFFRCVENIHSFSTSDNFLIVVKADFNDPSMNNPVVKKNVEKFTNVKFEWGLSNNKVHAINRDIPPDGWDIIVNMSDDVRFTVKGFDDIIREDCEPDMFLHYPEPFADSQCRNQSKPPISVVSIMDKIYFDRFGYIYHPTYISLWGDEEATEVARRLKRHKRLAHEIYSHDHPQAGKSVMDQQYRKTESFYLTDQKTFNRRMNRGFAV
jgi:hypothetical protein